MASGGEVFCDVRGGEVVSQCVFDCVRVGGGDRVVEGCGYNPCEDVVSEGCLIGVVLRAVMGQSDETRVREGWVCASWGGGRR